MSIGDWQQNDQLMKQYQAMHNAQQMGTTWTTNASTLGSAGLNKPVPGPVTNAMQSAGGWKVVTWKRPANVEEPVQVKVRPIIGFVQRTYSTGMTYVWADGAVVRQGDEPTTQLGGVRVLMLVGPDEADAYDAWQAEAQALCDTEVANEAAERLAPTTTPDEALKQAWASGYAKLVTSGQQASVTGTAMGRLMNGPMTSTNITYGGVPMLASGAMPANTTFVVNDSTTLSALGTQLKKLTSGGK